MERHRHDVNDALQRLRAADLHLPLLLAGLGAALVLVTIMAAAFIGGLHEPKPHQVPIGIVGPPPAAGAFASRVGAAARGTVDVSVLPTSHDLRRDIDERKVYGGIVLRPHGLELVVADAASPYAGPFLEAFFGQLALAQHVRLDVVHVKPLPPGDPRGVSPFYVVVGLVFGGYFGATILSVLGGTSSPSYLRAAGRMALLVTYAALAALSVTILADPVFGALKGNFAGVYAIAAFTIFATAAATAGLQAMLGMVGTGIALVFFILIGNPSTGGPVTNEFLPSFLRAIGPYLPGGAGTTGFRNVVYFHGNALGRTLIVLGVYAAVGSGLAIVAGWRRAHRTLAPEVELASAAAL